MTGGTPIPSSSTALGNRRTPMANRLQSPTSPFFLGSNDDQLERAQSRAARAASTRRNVAAPSPPANSGLSSDQIVELFLNCIKLASENKITQKNSWQLKLIDHLSEIIKVDAENDGEPNFQKASCTLEAGVKIYSARVDAVHSEAYKFFTRMKQAGVEYEQDTLHSPSLAEKIADVDHVNASNGECPSKPGLDSDEKISPLATLESSFEPLNVKKFDVAITVDPLYHQTSLLFDEGGIKGLLINKLGTYGGCCLLFDSFEVPGKYKSYSHHIDTSDSIDLSFAKESIEQMVMKAAAMTNISPTLKDIFGQLDEHNYRSLSTDNLSQAPEHRANAFSNKEPDFDIGILGNHHANLDDFDETSSVNERSSSLDSDFQEFLWVLGNTSKQNPWAGPDHWKYWIRRFKTPEDDPGSECGPNLTTKRSRNRSTLDIDIELMGFWDKEVPDIFSPPQNPKSTLLASNRKPPNNKLLEDCHYHPQDVVRLFLQPDVMFPGRRRIEPSAISAASKTCSRRKKPESVKWLRKLLTDENFWQLNSGLMPQWDPTSVYDDHYDDTHVYSDGEVNDGLISQPCKVKEIEIKYEKTTKQVDVHALKKSLWRHMKDSRETTELVHNGTISFKHILASFPINSAAAVETEDISPHMCFFCLLHLANEHGLIINGCSDLDDLIIGFLS